MTTLNTIRRASLGVVLASVCAIGLGGSAQAAERVRVGDLDLATPAGAATLHARIDVAAHRFCANAGERGLSAARACREDVSEEVRDGLSAAQRTALVAAAKPASMVVVATR